MCSWNLVPMNKNTGGTCIVSTDISRRSTWSFIRKQEEQLKSWRQVMKKKLETITNSNSNCCCYPVFRSFYYFFLNKQVMIIACQIYQYFFNLELLQTNMAANGDAKFHFSFQFHWPSNERCQRWVWVQDKLHSFKFDIILIRVIKTIATAPLLWFHKNRLRTSRLHWPCLQENCPFSIVYLMRNRDKYKLMKIEHRNYKLTG